MNSVEQTAKTVDEAVALALEKLGVSRSEVEVAILEVTNRSRLFGFLGQSSATVRVTVKQKKPEPTPAVTSEPEVVASPEEEVEAVMGEPEPFVEQPETPEPIPVVEAGGADTMDRPEEPFISPVPPPAPPLAVSEPSEFSEKARALVQEILDKMDMGATATVTAENGTIEIELDGPDLGILIGKRGMHLYALEYVVNTILGKENREHRKVALDGGGYRERREQALRELALSTARNVKQRGSQARLGRLRADERRVIHMTLQDDPHVRTFSEGDEPHRTIVIAPSGPPRR